MKRRDFLKTVSTMTLVGLSTATVSGVSRISIHKRIFVQELAPGSSHELTMKIQSEPGDVITVRPRNRYDEFLLQCYIRDYENVVVSIYNQTSYPVTRNIDFDIVLLKA